MPDVQCSKLVDADLASNWNFVKEIDNWATLLPGYQSHRKIDEFHSTWTVKGEVGVLARTVELEVSIDEWEEESKVAFSLKGLTEVVNGGGVFRLLGPGSRIAADASASTPATAEATGSSPGSPVRLSAGSVVRSLALTVTRLLKHLLSRLRRRATPQNEAAVPEETSPAAEPTLTQQVVPDGKSGFQFELSLVAGGMIGPVFNVMLEGMISEVGRDFADNVAHAIEAGRG